jgi:uncharacterized repeat protein (TIGR03803 family)
MQGKRLSFGMTVAVGVLSALTLMAGTRAEAQTEKVLHSFITNSSGDTGPLAGIISDTTGNLYGTTVSGGTGYTICGFGCGVVFELMPKAGGGWAEKVLHNFGNGQDGYFPFGGLIFDAAGNLYGTTAAGGAGAGGIVFELIHTASGNWTEKVLHNFTSDTSDGAGPEAGLMLDAAGNLFGTTTQGGGPGHEGTVFELEPRADGVWRERIIHSFDAQDHDGTIPTGSLVSDTAGNFYGTTETGGAGTCECGTVFELSPRTDGTFAYEILYSFGGGPKDGEAPFGGVIFHSGNLYGTTYQGGPDGYGTVFALSRKADSGWQETALYFFNSGDGMEPGAGLTVDPAGNLYGTTILGGTNGYGTAFRLTPVTGGGWTETALHNFGEGAKDGQSPRAGLIFAASGDLYGTTFQGGVAGGGTVFEIVP